MMTRLSLPRGLFVLLTSVVLTASFSQTLLASTRNVNECQTGLHPVKSDTLRALRERNTEALQRHYAKHPAPGFTDIAVEVRNEQVGQIGHRALQQALGSDYTLVASPAPGLTMDTAVHLHEEGRSLPVHVDIPWHGRRTSTTVYASLPKTIVPSSPGNKQYLIGPEYPVAIFHLHGGGTPTASGKNGLSIAQALIGQNIPLIGPDLMGHGQATRQLLGFMTIEQQVDWILEIIKKTIHPSVKVVLTGHSWGGQFAEYMWRHSDEEKYKQIEMFFPLSAPIDPSLGGGAEKKIEWEEYFERNFHKFKERIAQADLDFLYNSDYHSKNSDVATYFLFGSQTDYETPPVSPERQRRLKPKISIVGRWDGLVHVGVEEQYAIANSNLVAPSRIIILDERETWKSKEENGRKFRIGHNTFDAKREDGSGKLEVYSTIEEEVLKLVGARGMGVDQADAAQIMINNYVRQDWNNLIFRQKIESAEEYVVTSLLSKEDRAANGKRKVALDQYVNDVAEKEGKFNKELEGKIRTALAPLTSELGLHASYTASRAQQELTKGPLTEERKAELQKYMDAVAKVEAQLQTTRDKKWEEDLAKVRQEFSAAPADVAHSEIAQYVARMAELKAKKSDVTDAEKQELQMLFRLNDAVRARQNRFSQQKKELLESTPEATLPEGIDGYKAAERELTGQDIQPPELLRRFIERALVIETPIRDQAAREWHELVARIAKPAADQQRDDMISRENYSYIPAGNLLVTHASAMVKEWSEKRARLVKGKGSVDALEKEVRKISAERASLLKTWEGIWKKGDLASPGLREYTARRDQRLAESRELRLHYKNQENIWRIRLHQEKRETEAELLNPPREVLEARAKYFAAKIDFEKLRDQTDNMRWEQALNGQLEGSLAETAINLARELWGSSVTYPSAQSLTARVRALEAQLDDVRNQESIARQELDRAQWRYYQEMVAAGETVPFSITRVVIRDELAQDYHVLLNRLRNEPAVMTAFKTVFDRYMKYLAQMRVEALSKGGD